jgi:hypothetical protein
VGLSEVALDYYIEDSGNQSAIYLVYRYSGAKHGPFIPRVPVLR